MTARVVFELPVTYQRPRATQGLSNFAARKTRCFVHALFFGRLQRSRIRTNISFVDHDEQSECRPPEEEDAQDCHLGRFRVSADGDFGDE